MSLETEILSITSQKEQSDFVEYKPILPPSQNIAQIIAAMANTDGGYLILGASKTPVGVTFHGISQDFNILPVTLRGIDLLSSRPPIEYGYISKGDTRLFAIKVGKSEDKIEIRGKEYTYANGKVTEVNPEIYAFKRGSYERIRQISLILTGMQPNSTLSKLALINHYQGVLKIIDNLQQVLFPVGSGTVTFIPEGKILSRLLFSSAVDNFEVYLADLLYEICLARPETMKSKQTVTIEEVLNCVDIEEFIRFVAKRKISRLQKGSVAEFVKDNFPISALNVITETVQSNIERILQIRHLYTHRNGIIDEKFLSTYIGPLSIGTEYLLTIDEMLDKLQYLIEVIHQLDEKAIAKYKLG